MKSIRDLVIIGGGPAGMAAAQAAYDNGIRDILLFERDQFLGGILNQCIHPGFGLHYFDEELTGPEYADRFIKKISTCPEIEVSLKSFVVNLKIDMPPVGVSGLLPRFHLTCLQPGIYREITARALIMATGCRERTREMVHIPGSRPSGIFSAGLAQKLINNEGLLPGKEIVIIGSGDIGLIMARRFSLEGARVKAIVEIQKESRGLKRNLVQCVEDFDIPIYFSHQISRIIGNNRVEAVEVAPVNGNMKPLNDKKFLVPCDTVLLSVGLIPENELIEEAGVALDTSSNSPVFNENGQLVVTEAGSGRSVELPGLFISGNALQVYDLVDSVTTESLETGKKAADYLKENYA